MIELWLKNCSILPAPPPPINPNTIPQTIQVHLVVWLIKRRTMVPCSYKSYTIKTPLWQDLESGPWESNENNLITCVQKEGKLSRLQLSDISLQRRSSASYFGRVPASVIVRVVSDIVSILLKFFFTTLELLSAWDRQWQKLGNSPITRVLERTLLVSRQKLIWSEPWRSATRGKETLCQLPIKFAHWSLHPVLW